MSSNMTLLKDARKLAKSGSYVESARLFADYLEQEKGDDPQILLELGFALLLAGDEDGALRIYEALVLIMTKIKKIPLKLAKLWSRYNALIGGTKRKLVLTGVTALLLSGTACGSQPPVHSAHRYSGGVLRPRIELQIKEEKPSRPVPAVKPTTTTQKPATAVKPSTDLNNLRPYSGHKYSGGVLSSGNLNHIHQLIDEQFDTSVMDAIQPAPLEGSQSAAKPATGTTATPIVKPPVLNLDLKPISAHRYSGGVFLDFKPQMLREKSRKVKTIPEDEK